MAKQEDRKTNSRSGALHQARKDGKVGAKCTNTKTESHSVKEYQKYGWKVEYSTESEEGFSKKA